MCRHTSWLIINISHTICLTLSLDCVATFGMCGILNDSFVAILPATLAVKECWKSISIWRSFGKIVAVSFFLDTECKPSDTHAHVFACLVYCCQHFWSSNAVWIEILSWMLMKYVHEPCSKLLWNSYVFFYMSVYMNLFCASLFSWKHWCIMFLTDIAGCSFKLIKKVDHSNQAARMKFCCQGSRLLGKLRQ